jgi:hypothetical protein
MHSGKPWPPWLWHKSEIQDGLCGGARGIGVGLLAGVVAELLKFLWVGKQVFDPGCQLTGLLDPLACMPAFLDQMAESPFVTGRGVKHQDG